MSGGWWVVGTGVVISVFVVACGGEGGDTVGGDGLPVTDVDVVVTSVADGDSFRADAPTGEIEVRLLDINSPELDECFGQPAKEALIELIEGRTIGLATEPELDQFDRVLARAIVNGEYVNLEMVRSGHSLVVSEGSSDHETLIEAEEAARASEIGLWADDVCGAVGPRATLEFTGIDYDPPGADDDESVTILNSGANPIDLAGFVLRDESSVNRFDFPDITLDPGRQLVVARGCGDENAAMLLWCTEQPIWNNEGDTALLLDQVGRIVALHRY